VVAVTDSSYPHEEPGDYCLPEGYEFAVSHTPVDEHGRGWTIIRLVRTDETTDEDGAEA
jgi:uncharacterized membrane protein YhdT